MNWCVSESVAPAQIIGGMQYYVSSGDRYVGVTPGKTYTFTKVSATTIYYSQTINAQTPEVTDY